MADRTSSKVLEQCVAEAHRRPTIGFNSRKPEVRLWQMWLQREFRLPVQVTGVFDPATHKATLAVQSKLRLTPDGIVGPKTWTGAALVICSQRPAPPPPSAAQVAQLSQLAQQVAKLKQAQAVRGVGAMDFSFSVLDPKSMMLGLVLGVTVGAVLFRRK